MQMRGQGSLRAPELHATLRLVDLKLGNDIVWVALLSNKHRPGYLTPIPYKNLRRVND